LAESDYISLHIPLLEETIGFINTAKIKKMKKGVSILNFARGGLVHREDMLKALKADKVRCFVTDFPVDILLGNDKVITFPHLGASTPESEENCAENGNIKNAINFPDSKMPRNGGTRIIIGNKNVPGMVGKITSILADEQINISDMLNKHKNDMAYNIIDVDGDISDELVAKIIDMEAVVLVRVVR
jgi:D-3-phosphoglycerate dehydrogenase